MAQQVRPPVVAIMGHVDHGKTSLLDYIRQAHVAAGEAGGITQHIGAYQAEFQGKKITFLDTPGHAAFSKMRSRGAAATDIAVLVVAADDGVMPQTVESIKYIRTAGVPMIVAINKMDVHGANPETVKAQLTEHEVYVTGYGGDVEVVPLSAKTGEGVDTLLETIAMMGEILELKGDPAAPLRGVVIESSKDKFRGCLATVLVQDGTLHKRDTLFAEQAKAQVRTLNDAQGKLLESAGPGTPVEVTGFEEVPPVGAVIAQEPPVARGPQPAASATFDLSAFMGEPTSKLRLIVKADVVGSLEAIVGSLPDDEVEIIASGIGEVSESDIQMAETTGARIIAFQVKVPGPMKKLAERLKVRIRIYRIIYELLDDVAELIRRRNEPDHEERVTGEGVILKVFHIRGETILGVRIMSGTLRRGDKVHVQNGETVRYDGTISAMKQGKIDVDSMSDGEECGIVLTVAKSVTASPAEGDRVQAFVVVERE